jgi:glutaminase
LLTAGSEWVILMSGYLYSLTVMTPPFEALEHGHTFVRAQATGPIKEPQMPQSVRAIRVFSLLILGFGCGFVLANNAWADEPLSATEIRATLEDIYRTHRTVDEGTVYQSGAKHVDANWFGIVVATVNGTVIAVGDSDRHFPIQSTAKILTYSLALEDHGAKMVLERVGVNATGLPYSSLIASEVRARRQQNAMVSAGAIATMALINGSSEADKWQRVQANSARYAGEPVALNTDVFQYEIGHNTHSLALAYALLARELLWMPCVKRAPDCFEPPVGGQVEAVIERYLKSTSQDVTARSLALMGATLANGGVNPKTGLRAVSREHLPYILSAMVTAGMYDASGQWMSEVGIPAKSGVSGNIIAVVPNRMAIAVYSPPLDAEGNSVRGVRVIKDLARRWPLHLFATPGSPD